MSSPETAPRSARARIIAVVAGVVVAIVALGGGAFAVGFSSATPAATAPGDGRTTDAAPAARARPATLPGDIAFPTCSVSAQAKDEALADFAGIAIDTSTGDAPLSRDGRVGAAPGGTQLLATAATALSVLGPDYTLETRVLAGADATSVVLVGGGDPTLSRVAAGASVYPNAPTLADLAAQVRTALGDGVAGITTIVLDSSYWSSDDAWDDSWPTSLRSDGYLSEVTALQTDGDRKNPANPKSVRSDDPVMAAGLRFAKALGVPAATLQLGTAPPGAAELGSVRSQPVSSLVKTMLQLGDATLAESLARASSKVSGGDGSRASIQAIYTGALTQAGIDATGQTFYDGSGTSAKNAVTPAFFAHLLAAARSGTGDLDVLYNSLSVPGEPGTLEKRFASDATSAAGAHLRGIATAIPGERTLAGLLDAGDGTSLAFAFTATGKGVGKTSDAGFERLIAAIAQCGANLTNK
ncbi:D-alanyl-D-alanine carboxypeptidase [Galbitalea sp. SE-J8]|uniref:D-alanyl-D-alanine carboxypeptidase n=1 Tax=Galbitalea sp. SE-J8 TaxID=3054952 RepID=UPI00259D06B8|nr:D-alanyl-D-alanine carboxypeptidase [Galbitalea sp. SE-J8]MDM4763610.1 D-alanyl-D-alanine carboxypeptidase [Galbitalea sp. SE-J8]